MYYRNQYGNGKMANAKPTKFMRKAVKPFRYVQCNINILYQIEQRNE